MKVSPLTRGFSLLELLVVITIIAILAALLLPALSVSKAQGRQAQCLGNLKQLQTGWLMYLGDHGEMMPPNVWDGVRGQSAGSALGSWIVGNANDLNPTNIQAGVLWSYNPSLATYHCPADTSVASDNSTTRWRSYSLLNYLGAAPVNSPEANPDVSLYKQRGNQIKKSSQVMAFACEDASSINDGIFFVFVSPATEWKDYPSSRHSSGCTFSFCDGHVEYWKWKLGQPNDTEDLARAQAVLPEP